jgi:hypothetical protein
MGTMYNTSNVNGGGPKTNMDVLFVLSIEGSLVYY